ncbi:MAG: cobaltochelatase subunit CobN, partial [Cyanobacteria bacterium RU_5_0]|nr:cobaltochelatase subunit CobN [Cyanobacteria bacterium RU_5_0]
MHRLAATPGGWTPDPEGVIFIEQSQAPLVFLTAADTDIQLLAAATLRLPNSFPALRVANLLHLQQHLTIDTYADTVLTQAQAIVLRLLGGRAYWSYGLEVAKQTVQQTGASLFVLPGDDRPDPDLISHSTVSLSVVDRLWRYLTEGGIENTINALKFIADTSLNTTYNPAPPAIIPRIGLYKWSNETERQGRQDKQPSSPHSLIPSSPIPDSLHSPKIGLLFYRAHSLAGNTAPIDALCQALADRQLQPVPVFVSSLRDREVQSDLLTYFQPKEETPIQVLLNATSFSLARLDAETPNLELWQQLDVPVIQVILSSGTLEQWQTQTRGLSPRDVAMNVALPEVDGRIISRAISFKAVQTHNTALETDVVGYEAIDDRIQFVVDLAANWVYLRQTPPADRRIALILANYPTRDGRLANGVGLDTPASCIEILKALQQQGYHIQDSPATGDELIQRLTQGITNDAEGRELRSANQFLPVEDYQQYFATLPPSVQQGIRDRWQVATDATDLPPPTLSPHPPIPLSPHPIPIPGIQLGNIFIGIQPARGYDRDPTLNYHAPDLEPTHEYLAFYYWVRHCFSGQAIVHVGKHGNLEWLPGKAVALSEDCYSEVALGAMPHLYPFIVNDPGEGAQAKRRSQAVIIDHLTPPMTRAELYGSLQHLEQLIDEYYEAQSLDPSRLAVIRDRILNLVKQEHLDQELEIQRSELSPKFKIQKDAIFNFEFSILNSLDGYLCELKEAQIRDGLHIFGQCPQGRQQRDLIVAIARHPGQGRLGLTRAIAQDWQLDLDPLTTDPAQPFLPHPASPVPQLHTCRTVGDVIEALEHQASALIEALIPSSPHPLIPSSPI